MGVGSSSGSPSAFGGLLKLSKACAASVSMAAMAARSGEGGWGDSVQDWWELDIRHLLGFSMRALQIEELRVLLTAQEQRVISLLPGILFRPHPEDNAGNHAMSETRRKKTHKLSGWETVLGGVSSSVKNKS